jgi:purine-binding chemotaxis protein CheW
VSSNAIVSPASADGANPTSVAAQLAGKYMVFKLADQEYGLQILKVRELIGLLPFTRLPGSPRCVRGVINLRGRVIPVMDLRLKFGMPAASTCDQSVIIVVQYVRDERELTMGILVDEAVEVLNIGAPQIEPPPDFGERAVGSDFILGIGKADTRVICLLDVAKILTTTETDQTVDSLDQT